MEFVIESVRFVPYPVQFKEFRQSPKQPIGQHLYRCARKLRSAAKRTVPRKTGRLARSIDIMRYNRGFSDPSIEIGSDVNYSYLVHEGTRPHRINARPGRTLRFVTHGQVIYARKVDHPGTRANRYLSRHLAQAIA